jgi:V/A-type H+-transporting ATPase subunit E
MGLEAVVEEIRTKAKRESEEIRQTTQDDVRRILDDAQARGGKIKLAAEESVEKNVAHILGQEVSAANLLVKRNLLNTQKDILDQVYRKALEAMKGLPGSFHDEALGLLLARAKKQIPEGIVHSSERDRKTLLELLKKGELAGYTAGNSVDIEGGIIVESRDGELQLDYSYRTFLAQVWESGLKDASDILFG